MTREFEEIARNSLKRFGRGVYFHNTSIKNSLSIVSQNELILSPSLSGPESNISPSPYTFFASFSRTVNSRYFKNANGAFMVFDASVLKSKFKIKPVDYWQQQWLKDREHTLNPDVLTGRESEDRLFSPDEVVSLPYNSIKEVHLVASTSPYVVKLVWACKKQKIPVYAHRHEKTMRLLLTDLKHLVPVSELIKIKKGAVDTGYRPISYYTDFLDAVINVYNAKKLTDLKKKTRAISYYWQDYPVYKQDFINMIDAEISNLRSFGGKTPVASIVKIMKKNQFDFGSLYDFLVNKLETLKANYSEKSSMKPLYASLYEFNSKPYDFGTLEGKTVRLIIGDKFALYEDKANKIFMLCTDLRTKDMQSINIKVAHELVARSTPLMKSLVFSHRTLPVGYRESAGSVEIASPKPLDHKLYQKFVKQAKKKFEKWPSRVATWWVVKKYKKAGGEFSKANPSRDYKGYNWVEGDILTTEKERLRQIRARLSVLQA